jgi:hypothetical protein
LFRKELTWLQPSWIGRELRQGNVNGRPSAQRLAKWTLGFLSAGFACLVLVRGDFVKKSARQRLIEGVAITLSALVGYGFVELGYRLYLYNTFAMNTKYAITIMDAREAPINFGAPGSVLGPNPRSTDFHKTYYSSDDEILYRHKVHINNLGWTSRYDYSRTKQPDEYRIAVIGGSTTAALSNETAWVDVLQDRLNADTELLATLDRRKFTVLNLGMIGSGFDHFANPGALIARRFSADLALVNFSIESLALPFWEGFTTIPADSATVPDIDPAIVGARESGSAVMINGIEIRLYCSTPGPADLSRQDCHLWPLWYVAPGRELTREELRQAKQLVARRRLFYTVLMSPRPLVILELLGIPAITAAQAADESAKQDQVLTRALGALQMIRAIEPNLLLTHNPHIWHRTTPNLRPSIEHLINRIRQDGFDVVDMADGMTGEPDEQARWYTWDGHWNDRGSEFYGSAMYEVIRRKLLQEVAHDAAGDEVDTGNYPNR